MEEVAVLMAAGERDDGKDGEDGGGGRASSGGGTFAQKQKNQTINHIPQG